ncbi:hypothetical protein BC830DRAFT_1084131 [Chytriomyces sp. MP71]|nr:hypothetical protein BC830DRAFT_1084131 [Chytriomyces sp. MP71]
MNVLSLSLLVLITYTHAQSNEALIAAVSTIPSCAMTCVNNAAGMRAASAPGVASLCQMSKAKGTAFSACVTSSCSNTDALLVTDAMNLYFSAASCRTILNPPRVAQGTSAGSASSSPSNAGSFSRVGVAEKPNLPARSNPSLPQSTIATTQPTNPTAQSTTPSMAATLKVASTITTQKNSLSLSCAPILLLIAMIPCLI